MDITSILSRTRVAYFSMEIALRPEMHTYAGGLGILAGDTARSCGDLDLPVVFVTLASRKGYMRQEIDSDGWQSDYPDPWAPEIWAKPLDAMVAIRIEGRAVWVRPWLYVMSCPVDRKVAVLLLDTDLEMNDPRDRTITDRLYPGDADARLRQEIVLGIGGERLLRALGFTIETYHMNEGHAALLAVSLLRRYPVDAHLGGSSARYNFQEVRARCVFTTHTPVDAGHDRFDWDHVMHLLGDFMEEDVLRQVAGPDDLNMTRLALNLSGYVNGVAMRHAETTRRMFPGYDIKAITNGVHVPTWTHPSFAKLYQAMAPDWGHDPQQLSLADQLPDEEVWEAHRIAKQELIGDIHARTGIQLDLDKPILTFARRMTGYKRPDLLFADLARLRNISQHRPFQIVMAGKAHPSDGQGRALIHDLHVHLRALNDDIPAVFVPGYDMTLAMKLVTGSDILLNTPLPPQEASGTSGMKAALNGVLNLSILDGWWIEACIEGVTGWAIGHDRDDNSTHAAELYEKLERTVLPLYYDNRPRWIWMMKESISKTGAYFNSQRMMKSYASEAYFR